MRADFRPVPIGEMVDLIIDHRGRTPKKLGGEFAECGIQVISAKNVYGGRLHPNDSPRFVPPEMASRWMPQRLQEGDVLLTSEAPLGETAFLHTDLDYCLGQRLFALRTNPGVANGRFLYYALISPQVQRRLHARATGTTAQGIKQSELCQVEIDLPSIQEQGRIASVLGAFDDKLDSNGQLAALLEEAAATMFRAHFVDFVGADGSEESEIGRIPSGWKIAPLTDQVELLGGGTPSTSEAKYWEGDIPWISVKDTAPSLYVISTERHVSNLALSESRLRLYPRNTVVVTARGTVGNIAMMAEPMTLNQSCYAVHGRNGAGQLYVYFVLRRAVDTLRARSHGSVFPTITRNTFASINVAQPPHRTMAEFERSAEPLFELVRKGAQESATLATIRDTFLPKLISGEIRVPDTGDPEEVIGPAAEQLAQAAT